MEKLLDIIKRDVLNLSSGRKMSVIMTSTPLFAEDLTEKIEKDKGWKTEKHPAILQYPKDIMDNPQDGLWAQYFAMYDEELVANVKHHGSLEFYQQHFEEMNEGAETFANRFKREDGHISGLQALLDKRHLIGEIAFDAEFQMRTLSIQSHIPVNPELIAKRKSTLRELEIPS